MGRSGEVDEARLRVQGFWEAYRSANVARLAGRFDEAEEGYRAALAFDPEHEDALYYLGNVLLERGAYEPAADTWLTLVTVNPAGARAYGQLGRLALCRTEEGIHDLAAAVRFFRTAHQLNREETGSQLRLAEAFLLRGQVDSATVYLDAVLGSHTASSDALYLRSWIDWSQGNRDRATRRFREGVASGEAVAPPPVAGEGDTRQGATPIGQSEVGCPALAGLVPPMPLAEPDLVAAFQATSSVLASRR